MTIMNEIVGESGTPGKPGCRMMAVAMVAATVTLLATGFLVFA